MNKTLTVLACITAIAATTGITDSASACGGCFAPTGSPTVVTRHQMAVSMTPEETTLWDQIEYAGDPEDFVWVLPVRGGVPVELADNAFFEALEQQTRITLQAPQPPRTFCSDPCGGSAFDSTGAPSADGGAGRVTVHHQAAIGPYETATIGSEDPDALVEWLRGNGYAVPDAVLPTIAHYTDQGMDFAVLRLSPNFGVTQMQPVRVTMEGLNPAFPLRMVSAGVVGKVGLELFVFAEGRYGPMNFEGVEVDRSALTFDWNDNSFNYDELYADAATTAEGRVWVSEYAMQLDGTSIGYYESYDPETGERHSAADDWAVVTRNLSEPYLTRLTSDLPAEFLTEDLILGASTGGDLNNFINVTNELNRAADVVCPTECNDPYGSGTIGGWRGAGRGDGLCSVTPGRTAGSLFGALGLLGAAIAFGVRRRR